MQKLLSAFSDDTGATSMTRVVMFLVVAAVIISKFTNSYLTKTPITWETSDMEMIGLISGVKLIQNVQEASPTTAATPQRLTPIP